jgi:hypothetical protein
MLSASIQRFGWMFAMALAPGAALAQDGARVVPNAAYAVASPAADPLDTGETADTELTPEESAALSIALSGAPDLSMETKATKSLRFPALAARKTFDASRTIRAIQPQWC